MLLNALITGRPICCATPLAVEHASVDRIDAAIAKLRMVVADIDNDDTARHVRKQPPWKIGDGLRWDRDDHDLSGFGGFENGNGRRVDLGRQRCQTFRSSRVRNRDVMVEVGEVARKYASHASSADNSDSHVDFSFFNLQTPAVRAFAERKLFSSPSTDFLADAFERNAFTGIKLGSGFIERREQSGFFRSIGLNLLTKSNQFAHLADLLTTFVCPRTSPSRVTLNVIYPSAPV
jgi:hypothetical protein